MQSGSGLLQTAWTGWLWRTISCECEVLCLNWGVGLEAKRKATVAKVQCGNVAVANGTSLQLIVTFYNRAKVFAVAAILPLDFRSLIASFFEMQLS
ncbi:MAG: hypothetical protein C5B55_14555 [Blastocatellia bacterium]|nr:MAG: hypothetical protein C5B55_14555 [Blastocatellia bacterium]